MLTPRRIASSIAHALRTRFDRLTLCVTADDVAHLLANERVSGHRLSARACPLASYLARSDDHVDVLVTRHGVQARDRRNRRDFDAVWFDLPPAALVFVVAFDNGAYPELRYAT